MNDKSEAAGRSKIGAGHLEAAVRQGFVEIRNALYPESNVAQRYPEPGLYGTAVSSEIAAERKADLRERSIEERVQDAERQAEASRDTRETPAKDMERE